MRIPRPRTLLSLILTGLALVSLPLLVGVGTAVFRLNGLAVESAQAVRASADSTRENERAATALTNIRRYSRQYLALDRDAQRLEFFRGAAVNLDDSLSALRALEHPPEVDAQIATIRATLTAVSAMLETPEPSEEILLADLDTMDAAAATIATLMRAQIAERLTALQNDTRDTQTLLAWQAAALVPGAVILIGYFTLMVGRPMRRVDRAIRELGKGDFSHPIAIAGPTDIETLGRQLEWLRQRLAETTAEKNKFLRHMSHELKTPLANIREGSDLMLDGSVGMLDRQQEEVMGILRENSIKLQRLIENLLTFSAWQARTASLEITEFELKPVVFATISQHRLVISNRRIELVSEVAPVRVHADEGKLRLVLENLVSNAIKFTPEDGRILVRAALEGAELVIEVADSGPGVLPEDRSRIFEAFYQGRRQQGGPVGGTGIGLSVVQECVVAHGGSVELRDSAEPGGAHFVVRLPIRRAGDRPRLQVAHG